MVVLEEERLEQSITELKAKANEGKDAEIQKGKGRNVYIKKEIS